VTGWIFCLALLVRIPAVLLGSWHVPPAADGRFYHVVAQRIAEGHGYTWLWPDGAVTYAAHYPIGYPAMVGVGYALFGPHAWVAMAEGALLSALGVAAMIEPCRRLVQRSPWPDRAESAARWTGILLALSPSLVAYVPALMTELPVAALGALCLRACLWVRDGATPLRWVTLGVLAGLSVLFRPQMLVFAPVWGALSVQAPFPPTSSGRTRLWLRRTLGAVGVLVLALGVVAPWTARNCVRMEQCTLVSANGGWNLLLGTFPEGQGAWIGVDGERVPSECRTVFHEAKKDTCFGQAGARRIREQPLIWLSLLPAKWRATFDFTGAAASHLHEAGTLGDRGRLILGGIEIVTQRLGYGACLLGLVAWLWVRRPRLPRWALLGAFAVGIGGLLGLGAWIGLLVLLVLGVLALDGANLDPALTFPPLALAATALVHGVFFGAGRYSLPLVLWTAPWLALGLAAGELLTAKLRPGDNR
jgi:hypothetical protein